MSVKNFVQCGLVTPVATNTTELVLVAPTASYQYPPLDGGTLVIADSVARPTFYEIISYTHRIDNVLYGVVRAKEGTTARSWTGSVWVYQALTAADYVDALALKAPLASPALAGVPTAPTAAPGTNTNQIATMAAVQAAIAAVIGSSPAALDALNELAAAIANDPNFASTMNSALAGKEPSIAAGTSAQMWLGNKTWASVLTQVQNTLLTGLGVGSNATILNTDTLIAALAKIQNQLNNTCSFSDARLIDSREWTATQVTQVEAEAGTATTDRKWTALRIAQAIRGNILTGLNLTVGTAVVATDTLLVSVGKLQKQITDIIANIAGNVRATPLTGYLLSSNAVLTATDTVLTAFGKIQAQLNAKASLDSPDMTGVPKVPTASVGTNTTQMASTAYTVAEIGSRAPTKTGTGASGSWDISITGSAASCTGNAASATTAAKLSTAHTINGVSFDGTAGITVLANPTVTLIAGSTDLNSLQTPGNYYCPANATVATLLNCPTGNAFTLEVSQHAGVRQELHEYMTASPKSYFRNFYNSVWGTWARMYTTIDPQPADNAKLSLTGGTMTGALTREMLAGSAGIAVYRHPQGAVYNGGASVTGTLKITLPVSWTDTMLRIKLVGYTYQADGATAAFEIVIGGYNYSSSGQWLNTSACSMGAQPFGYNVRFGHDGTKCCILLGITSLNLPYPKIIVEEIQTGFGGADLAWGSGWSISQIASEAGITVTTTTRIDKNSKSDLLQWMNYGQGHSIFDASSGLAPNGAAISNTDPTVDWIPNHPTLMGWNGTNTYGVRVARAKMAESLSATKHTMYSADVLAVHNVNQSASLFLGSYYNSNQYGLKATYSIDGIGNIQPIDIGYTYNGTTISAMKIQTSGNVELPKYTQLGESAPKIKLKKLTGTTPAAEGGTISVAHGLSSAKIIGIQVFVAYGGAGTGMITGASGGSAPFGEYDYTAWFDATNVILGLHSTFSATILSKPFTVLITYEE